MSNLNASTLRNRLRAKGRFRHMQAFVETADLGSLNKAALSLHVTQPAVTHQLRELEGMLGIDLFVRHAKGVRLTETGALLLPIARRILRSLDESASQAAAQSERIRGYVRVGAVGNALHGVVCEAIAAFCDINPRIVVEIEETLPAALSAKILHDEVELGFCRSNQPLPDGWAFETLLPDRFCAVAGPRHPLAHRKRIKLEELRQQVWLTPPLETSARAGFEDLFVHSGELPAGYSVSTRAPILMWRLLEQRNLLSFMPKSVAQPFLQAGLLTEIALPRNIPIASIGMVARSDAQENAAAVLADFLRKRFAKQARDAGPRHSAE